MGPRATPPPLPAIEANLLCEGPRQISILLRECNWMQGLEGEMDTVHAAFLHGGANRFEDTAPGSFNLSANTTVPFLNACRTLTRLTPRPSRSLRKPRFGR